MPKALLARLRLEVLHSQPRPHLQTPEQGQCSGLRDPGQGWGCGTHPSTVGGRLGPAPLPTPSCPVSSQADPTGSCPATFQGKDPGGRSDSEKRSHRPPAATPTWSSVLAPPGGRLWYCLEVLAPMAAQGAHLVGRGGGGGDSCPGGPGGWVPEAAGLDHSPSV